MKKNITLIGMPFSGKSTIGEYISKKLNYELVDLDKSIEERYNMKLSEIVLMYGNEQFKKIEENAMLQINGENKIISTGGSVIYCEKGIEYLKSISKLIFLNVGVNELLKRMNNITMEDRAIVFKPGQTFEHLYHERIPLYLQYCCKEIKCDSLSVDKIANKILNVKIVCKFGGSSLQSSDSMRKIYSIIKDKLNTPKLKIILVFSASGKTTDKLLKAGKTAENFDIEYKNILEDIFTNHINFVDDLIVSEEIKYKLKSELNKMFELIKEICTGIYYLKDFSEKTSDYLLSFGEKMSNLIMYNYLSESIANKNIKLKDSTDFFITDYKYGNGQIIVSQTKRNLNNMEEDFDILIFPGFIGKNESGFITTLGRGGGDYTAALLGSFLNVDLVEIWTDVNGIMTSDPRIVKRTKSIDNISYNEMMELSHYGANVIYTPTILPLYNSKIPLIVKNTFNPEHRGTCINFDNKDSNRIATAISNIKNVTLIKVFGNYLIGNIGFSSSLFSMFSNKNINIIMISQSSSEHSIYVVINQKDYDVAKFYLNQLFENKIKNNEVILKFWNDKSVLSIETNKSENIIKISAIIYPIFLYEKVKIYTQTTSDHNICVILDRENLNNIQISIHDKIFEV